MPKFGFLANWIWCSQGRKVTVRGWKVREPTSVRAGGRTAATRPPGGGVKQTTCLKIQVLGANCEMAQILFFVYFYL
jgi:hypothetical protein